MEQSEEVDPDSDDDDGDDEDSQGYKLGGGISQYGPSHFSKFSLYPFIHSLFQFIGFGCDFILSRNKSHALKRNCAVLRG